MLFYCFQILTTHRKLIFFYNYLRKNKTKAIVRDRLISKTMVARDLKSNIVKKKTEREIETIKIDVQREK